jgi:dephospho-CoA kinase
LHDTDLFVIGLTGPSGAGKSTVAAILASYGFPIIDADAVYHELLIPPSPCLDALTEAFSTSILDQNGALNRAALSALVFEDSDRGRERRALLNRITHRFVIEETEHRLARYRSEGVRCAVIDAPLLLEASMDADCDFTIAVLADRNIRLQRLRSRDNRSEQALLARIHAQPDDEFYRSRVNTIVYNNGDITALQQEITRLCQQLEVLT